MLEQIGRFAGMFAADVVNAFRGRQAVPCSVDWDEGTKPPRPDVRAVFKRPVQTYLDDCTDCEGNCCITTDTLNEWGK